MFQVPGIYTILFFNFINFKFLVPGIIQIFVKKENPYKWKLAL